ncbi:hypothetical protein BDR26DRAFT_1006738 [Obelidium mucronatum]|nr:hypothetical protein BDR26DRAFT_1006738 [Obelidium mucronatum]
MHRLFPLAKKALHSSRLYSRLYSSAPPPFEYKPDFHQVLQTAQPVVNPFKFRWKAVKIGVFVLGSVSSLSAFYVIVSHKLDEKRLKETLVKGTCPSIHTTDSEYIHRPSVESQFERMVTPSVNPASYFVVVGEQGTGKSTMMKAACSKVGSGVIYVNVPEDVQDFGESFADSIGFNFRASNSLLGYLHTLVYGEENEQEKERNWKLPYRKFKKLAIWYREKYGTAPVLVIDNTNFLAMHAEYILEVLQLGAKGAIDENLFVTVFVTSDGFALTQMEKRSAFSRGKLYRVGDLDDVQIKEFLSKRKIEPSIQDQVRDLVGGRVLLLSKVCEELNAGIPFEIVKSDQMKDVERRKKRAVKPHNEYIYNAVCRVATSQHVFEAEECQGAKAMTEEEFFKLEMLLDSLVIENILSKVDGGYTFHSNVERAYVLKECERGSF